MRFLKTLLVMTLAAGCAVQTSGQADRQPQPQPQPTAGKPTPSSKKVDPAVVERLQRVMLPLVAKMNKPLPANQVKVGEIMAKPLPVLDINTDLDEAYRLLLAGNTGVLATSGDKVIDIITRIDLVSYWRSSQALRRDQP